MEVFACPECNGEVEKKKNFFSCMLCKKKYKIKDGVPFFYEKEAYLAEMEEKQLNEILRNLKKNSMDDFLKYLEKTNKKWFEYMTDNTRGNVAYVLSPKKYDKVLDLGCGYGKVSFELARIFKQVYSLDITIDKLFLINELTKKLKTENIYPLRANAMELPFKKDSFDAITIIGVLEWVPEFNEGKPKDIQLEFLKRMRDILTPGGEVVIGIENRIGLQYFMGWPDHNNLIGTTLMPRFLANAYSKARGRGKYRAYTYTIKGYEKLLKKAGFKHIRFYSPLRSYRYPSYIFDLKTGNTLKYFIKKVFLPKSKKERYMRRMVDFVPSIFLKYMSPHFLIVARK